jgi:hypothetical protein
MLSADVNEDKNEDWSEIKLSSELKTPASAVGLNGTSVIGELKISLEYIQRHNGYAKQKKKKQTHHH